MPAAPPADTRLHGRWLLLARLAWLAVALLTVGLIVAGVPGAYAQLQRVCPETAQCDHPYLTINYVRELQHFGLATDFFATYFLIVLAVFVAVWLAVGGVIFARKSDDWMALLVSLMLVVFGPTFVHNREAAAAGPI